MIGPHATNGAIIPQRTNDILVPQRTNDVIGPLSLSQKLGLTEEECFQIDMKPCSDIAGVTGGGG